MPVEPQSPAPGALAPSAPSALPGEVLGGRYRLVRSLGREGLAESFEAEALAAPGQRVLVKVLDPRLTEDATLRGRLLREVEAASRLVHPHILVLGEVDVSARGAFYCVSEMPRGRSLRALFAERGRLAPGRAVRLLAQALDALAYAHERGVVHRDLKPESILLEGPEGAEVVRVADFGLAKLIDGDEAGGLTAPGEVLGTLQYMAPEQAQAGAVDGRADQYAAAVVLYEALAGDLPFREPSRMGYLVAHLTKPPPRLTARFPALALPRALDDAIQRALAKAPADRFADARAFRAALVAAVGERAAAEPAEASAAGAGLSSSALTVAIGGPARGLAGLAARDADPDATFATTGTSTDAPTVATSGGGAVRAGGPPAAEGGVDRSSLTTEDRPAGRPYDSSLPTRGAPPGLKAPAPGPSALDLGPGAVIGKYRIEGVIGGGGMGRVYRARHVHMGREAALKVLLPHLARDAVVRERFRREARVAALFRHPSVVELYDFDDLDGLCFLAMELCDGQSLDAVLKATGPLPPPRVGKLVDQLLDALEAAHQAGVVHRDLKPANVMVLREDRIKVLDFGIARILEAQPGASGGASLAAGLTLLGDFVGTPAYAAPEQIQGAGIDARADLYTVGVILFQLLAGRLPFLADSPRGYLAQHLVDLPPALGDVRPALRGAGALQQVIARALEKRPAQRFATARAMRDALRDALAEGEGGAARGGAAAPPLALATAGHRAGDASGAVTALGNDPAARAAALAAARPTGPSEPLGPRLALAIEGVPGLRRLFLIGGERLAFGRGREDKRRGVRNDVVLRVLPCRSPELDPESWQLSVRISQAHGELRVRGGLVTLTDQSSRGTAIDGARVEAGRPRALGDRFEMDIGAGALVLTGTVARDARGARASSLEHAETALEDGAPAVSAVVLRRRGNVPEHAYALVVERLVVGQPGKSDLGLESAEPLPERLFAVERAEGGFALRPLGDPPAPRPAPRRGWLGLLTFGAREEPAAPALTAGGRALPAGEALPLRPGVRVSFGALTFEASELDDDAYSAI